MVSYPSALSAATRIKQLKDAAYDKETRNTIYDKYNKTVGLHWRRYDVIATSTMYVYVLYKQTNKQINT